MTEETKIDQAPTVEQPVDKKMAVEPNSDVTKVQKAPDFEQPVEEELAVEPNSDPSKLDKAPDFEPESTKKVERIDGTPEKDYDVVGKEIKQGDIKNQAILKPELTKEEKEQNGVHNTSKDRSIPKKKSDNSRS
jgi:hypothetical protein